MQRNRNKANYWHVLDSFLWLSLALDLFSWAEYTVTDARKQVPFEKKYRDWFRSGR